MITTVGSIAALTAALATAQGGDTILLASGDYGRLSITNMRFSSAVTIASETPNAPASITGLSISGSNGLVFRSLDFVADPAMGGIPLYIKTSQNLTFDRVYVHGSLDGTPGNDAGGLYFTLSSNITITNSEFEELHWGINHDDSNGLTIRGNTFHDIRMDGIRGGGSSNVTITGNSFKDFYPLAGDHYDAIQFWTTNTTASVSNIQVTDNIIIRGNGSPPQGVFLRDETGNLPYQNVTISGNLIVGALYNGIYVSGGFDVVIANNVVNGFVDQRSWITLGNVNNGRVSNNATTEINYAAGVTNVVQSGTVIIVPAADDGDGLLAQWLAVRGSGASASIYSNVSAGAPPPSKSIQGDLGANRLIGDTGDDTITGQSGNDTISDSNGSNYLRGDDGNDLITGGRGFDDINGNAGNDTVRGGNGNDWVVGGKDNDFVTGDAGNDIVYGNMGNDSCDGNEGNDIVRGGQGDDLIKGNDGNDYVSGDKGNDTVVGGAGADTFHSFGDAGIDRVLDFSLAEGDRVLLDVGTSYAVSQVGVDTVIDMVGGGQMILVGVSMASLTGAWLVVG